MRDLRMRKKAYGNKGFTLVELIVVLIVMCILASVAVLSIVGYIDRSRYNKNEQNAQSIYQAAQQAINRYAYTGKILPAHLPNWLKSSAYRSSQLQGTRRACHR